MLVEMYHSRSIQVAYKAINPQVCAVCREVIPRLGRYTRHQAPDPRHRDPITGRYRMWSYIACGLCAPYTALEEHTGELDMRAASMLETQVALPIVRGNTERMTALKKIEALAQGGEPWII